MLMGLPVVQRPSICFLFVNFGGTNLAGYRQGFETETSLAALSKLKKNIDLLFFKMFLFCQSLDSYKFI